MGRGRRERGEVGGGEERELRRRLGLAAEDDFGTRGRVRGEDAVITEHVKPRRRDEGAEPRDEVEGVEQDGVGAVFPRGLEGEADAPVAVKLEAVLVERRTGDVAAEPLEALAVAAVDDDLGVDIDPAHLGEGFAGRGDEAHGADEPFGLRAGRRAEELHVSGRRGVAGREDGLLVDERVALVARAFERAAVPLEHDEQPGVGPRGDLRDLVAARRRQRVEDKRALRIAHVHAIERQRVEVDIN